jgi:TRAP-type C4-dicarboxylate transport system permease small subunit
MIDRIITIWCIYLCICTLIQAFQVIINKLMDDLDYKNIPHGIVFAALMIAIWIVLAPFLVPIWLPAELTWWARRHLRRWRGRG